MVGAEPVPPLFGKSLYQESATLPAELRSEPVSDMRGLIAPAAERRNAAFLRIVSPVTRSAQASFAALSPMVAASRLPMKRVSARTLSGEPSSSDTPRDAKSASLALYSSTEAWYSSAARSARDFWPVALADIAPPSNFVPRPSMPMKL